MVDWITTYFFSCSVIPGGIQINLGYPTIVFLIWIMSGFVRNFLKRFSSKKGS